MAHVAAAKATARQKGNVIGKRRGVKVFGGSKVRSGAILVRQLGTKILPGKNVELGKDYTIFATADGIVKFTQGVGYKRGKKVVNVIPETKSK